MNPPRYDPVAQARDEGIADEHWASYLQQLRVMPDDELYRYSVGLLRTYVAYFGRDLSNELERSTLPVHIMHGTADPVVSFQAGEKLHRLIPNSRMHRLEGLTHGLFYYGAAASWQGKSSPRWRRRRTIAPAAAPHSI